MENDRAYRSNQNNLILRKIVLYMLGTVEILFTLRLIFKLFRANPGGTFVAIIYNLTGDFLNHFGSLFKAIVNNEIETESILEPFTFIAMMVYLIMAYGIVWLFEIYEIPKDRGM